MTTDFGSNGERIYVTGPSSSGHPITYVGGNLHLQMMGGGCATCHGIDRAGRRMMPEFWTLAPALTAQALFDARDGGRGHRDHAAYDEATLKRAVFGGITPSSRSPDSSMPRWSMSDEDWHDLLAYLRG